MPETRDRILPRVLFAAEIDPSHKFGTFEEQTLSLCRAFQERAGLFLPLYSTPLGPRASAEYRALGLRAESLDLGRFRVSTLARLSALVREHRIEVVHWNFYEPIKNGYLWGLSLLTPTVRHFLTDHTSRPATAGRNGGLGAPDKTPPLAKGGSGGLLFRAVRVGSEPSSIPPPRGGRPELRDALCAVGGGLKNAAKRLVFRRYEKIFGVSDFVSESLQDGRRWGNVSRWNHLVNTDRFSPCADARREFRDRHGIGDRFAALVVAQLMPEKGVDVAIRALQGVPDGAELWVVGGGDGAAGLEELARGLGLADRVRFFGVQWDVAPFMRAADCLVCPSRWAEAAGLVNVEALACGLPVVASRIGGIPEYVDDGLTGVLFPPGDVRRLSDALSRLQAAPPALRALSTAARAAALERFSIQNRIHDYLDYYDDDRNPETKPAHGDPVHATA